MIRGSGAPSQIFKLQADATLVQAAPVQNTWYTVLNTTSNVRLIKTLMVVVDTGETLQMEITIDGNTITGTQVAVAGTIYEAVSTQSAITAQSIAFGTISAANLTGFIFEGRSVSVRVRKTTAAGVGSLSAKVVYARR